MDWLDEELKRAMAREEAPQGFAARVTAGAGRRRIGFTAPRWLAAAAAIVLVAGAGYGYRWRQGTQARDQVLLALRLTAVKMNHIQAEVQEAGR